jgi:putative transposase
LASGIFHQLYFHFVWATRERLPVLEDADVRQWLLNRVEAECVKRKATVLALNAMPDHVHLLVNLPPCDLTQFIGPIKGASSFAFNQEYRGHHLLYWQDGYGVISLRAAEVEKVARYVINQERIHAARRTSDILETTQNIEEPAPLE